MSSSTCSRLVAIGGALRCCTDSPGATYSYATCASVGANFPALSIDLDARLAIAQRVRSASEDTEFVVGRRFADDVRVRLENEGPFYCPYSFSYTLPHDGGGIALGLPLCDDVDTLTNAATCPSTSTLGAIPKGQETTRPLEGIADAANAMALAGSRARDADIPVSIPRYSTVGDATFAYDLAEAYAMTLLREYRLDDFATEGTPAYQAAEDVLGRFLRRFPGAPPGLVPETLFRCPTRWFVSDCRYGPYVSQLLYTSYYDGASPRDRRVAHELGNTVELTRRETLLNAHRGQSLNRIYVNDSVTGLPSLRYVDSGRVLASIVHGEPPDKHYREAALVAIGELRRSGIASPFDGFDGAAGRAAPSTTAGLDDVLATVSSVTLQALRQSYAYKWISHRKMRPDQAALRLDSFRRAEELNISSIVESIPFATLLVDQFFEGSSSKAQVMEEIANANFARSGERNYLLASLYEGPAHPSSTHGHATVAGAAVTVLKAMLTTTDAATGAPLAYPTQPLTAGPTGDSLEPYAKADAISMTVEGELDKLAHNLGVGRNWAGVHFRTELEYSLALGEAVGIAHLRAKLCEYHVARTQSFQGWNLRLFNGTRILLKECDDGNRTTAAIDEETTANPLTTFGPHTIPGSAANFERLRPKPTLRIEMAQPVSLDRLEFTQRQMAFGDASIRRMEVSFDDDETTQTVLFGEPDVHGATGTLFTDLTEDPYGRCGTGASIPLSLTSPRNVSSIQMTVQEIHNLIYPSDWGICSMDGVHTIAGTAANFERLSPKPELRLDVGTATPLLEVKALRLTPRQMAFGDASIRTMDVILNDAETYRVDFGEPSSDGLGGTLLTDLSKDPYGRSGTPLSVEVSLDRPTNVSRVRLVVREVYDLVPPPMPLCETDVQWTRWKDYFAYARQGSWNFGLVNVSFHQEDGVLVPSTFLDRANFTSTGAFSSSSDVTQDIFHPRNPFFNAYDSTRNFVNGDGHPVPFGWCWHGEAVLAGNLAEQYTLNECFNDAEELYQSYARDGSWNVGLVNVSLHLGLDLLPRELVLDGANITSNGAFSSNADPALDIFHPRNPFVNAYDQRFFVNGMGCHVTFSWCWPGEAVLAGTLNNEYSLAPPTTVAFGLHDVPGTPGNFLYLTPKPRIAMNYEGATPLMVDEVRFVQRQMAFGDSTAKRIEVSLNGDVFDVSFGKANPDDPSGLSGSLWTDLSLDQYGRFGTPASVSLSLTDEIALTDFAVDVVEVHPFEPPLSGTGGSTGDCGGRDIYAQEDPTNGMSGGGKDRFGVLTRFGAWNVGFVSISFYRQGVLVGNYLDDATVTANGWQNEEVSYPINAFKNPYAEEYADYSSTVGSIEPNPFDPKDVCNNHQRAWSWFGTRVLGGFEPDFRLILSPDLVTTQQYVERVGAANLPALLVQLAEQVGEAGFVPE